MAGVSRAKDLKERLKRVKRTRQWLAEETGYAFHTIRQYLGGSRQSDAFDKRALEVLEAEEARLKAGIPALPQWNLIFSTEEQFQRADRASRIVGAESFTEFCRQAILKEADEILATKKRTSHPPLRKPESSKVAEDSEA